MADPAQSEFRKDMTGYRKAVAQILKLCRGLPDGLDRLKAFNAKGGALVVASEQVVDGCVVVVSAPSDRLIAFRDELTELARDRAA